MTDMHKHCPVCSTPIPLDETTCSPKCQSVLDNRQTQVAKGKTIVYIVMGICLLIGAYVFMAGNGII